jgi:hypothetical protein
MRNILRLKLVSLFSISSILLGHSLSGNATMTCDGIYPAQTQRVALQQLAISKGTSQLLRSNALHFWQWNQTFANLFFSEDILAIKGFVVGDPHNGNFAPTLINNSIKWISVDYDDGGKKIPLILDFVRYLSSVKAVTDEVKSKDLWDAYLDGLNGKQRMAPNFVQKLLDMTTEEYRQLQNKKALKNSEEINGSWKLIIDEVENFQISDSKTQIQIHNKFQELLLNMKVLDVVGRQKDSGGSKDAARYLALAKRQQSEKNSEFVLYEMKQKLDSAVDEYELQDADNFSAVLDFFIGKDENYQQVQIINKKQNNSSQVQTFLLRPKQLYLIDVTNNISNNKDLQKFKELSEFNAWYIGYKQHQQPAGLKLQMALQSKDTDIVLINIKTMVKQYLDLLEAALKNKKH